MVRYILLTKMSHYFKNELEQKEKENEDEKNFYPN
jgi:hypothetical protein